MYTKVIQIKPPNEKSLVFVSVFSLYIWLSREDVWYPKVCFDDVTPRVIFGAITPPVELRMVL